MNNKGLILVNTYSKSDEVKQQVTRFIEEFGKFNIKVEVKNCNALIGYLAEDVIVNETTYDFVVYLDKDKYISTLLEKINVPVFNKALAIDLCDDKMSTYLTLVNNQIKMPITLSAPLCYSDSVVDREFLDYVEEVLSYPLIVKESYGSKGKQVYLIENKDELLSKAQELIHKPHLFQEFIKSSYGKDIRVIVIDKKAVAWMMRKSENDFRSNISSGGVGYPVELTDEYRKMAEKACAILDLDYAGVDLLIGENNEPILCEVNSNAFFTGIEKTTGINVCGLYAKHIYNKVYLK